MPMSDDRFKRLGSVKQKELNADFDSIYEKYRKKALDEGYTGELRLVKEKGRVIFFVVI